MRYRRAWSVAAMVLLAAAGCASLGRGTFASPVVELKDVRVKGAIGVVEMDRITDRATLCAKFAERGVFIRPLENAIYLTPAFTITQGELSQLTGAIAAVLRD